MTWPALPFDRRGLAAELVALCGVQGVPSLVILGPDGGWSTAKGWVGLRFSRQA